MSNIDSVNDVDINNQDNVHSRNYNNNTANSNFLGVLASNNYYVINPTGVDNCKNKTYSGCLIY